MATEYKKSGTAGAIENYLAAEALSGWNPTQYEAWNYGKRADPAAAGSGINAEQQQHSIEPAAGVAAPGSQPWLGYYSSQHLQHLHPAQQQGIQAQTNQGPPPLPSAPPPQPPPPPEPPSSLPSWSSVVAGGPESRSGGFSHPQYYNHQQQSIQDPYYGGGEAPVNGNFSSSSSTPLSNATVNGSNQYGQTYAGYSAATSGDQYAYGSENYSGHPYHGYPQQGNDSCSQNVGTPYQVSGAAPYPSVNSFSDANSYADSTSYQTTGTYYNAGVYQNTGGYPSASYSGHPNSWSENNYGSYGSYHGYTGYGAQDQNNSVAVASATQYQQDYHPQWAEFYTGMETNPPETSDNAPGTAPPSTPPPTYASVVAQGPGGPSTSAASNQPPPPGTQPSWQSNAQSFGSAGQANSATSHVPMNWDASSREGSQAGNQHEMLQNHFQSGPQQIGNVQPQSSMPAVYQQGGQAAQLLQAQQTLTHPTQPEAPSMRVFQSQGPTMMKPVPQWRSGKIQIPTNPRIASNFVAKGNSGVEATHKPAYISVGAKAGKLSSDDVTDATLQPGMFPSSLRAYVERALSRCKDEMQKSACQDIMKEIITAASRDGSLFVKNWDTEPLFPLPSMPSTSSGEEVLHRVRAGLSGTKPESPIKRPKSRWGPVGEDDAEERHGQGNRDASKIAQDRLTGRDNSVSPPKWEKPEGAWNRTRSLQQQNSHLNLAKRVRRGSKRGQKASGLGFSAAASTSESEDETETGGPGLAGVILGSLVAAENPEEKKRRQSRTKRFHRGKDAGAGMKMMGKLKPGVGGTASARRATALQLAMSYGDGNGHAVEDIDWDALTIKGTSQEIEKRYLRLTSAPDPGTVRPEEVLKTALAMVQTTPKSYLYRCEQLKSIRQDLTVQRIRDELTVQVYETHARMALESGDFPEYNQCQAQLKGLYAEGIEGSRNEFAGYSLLYTIFNHGNSRDLLSTMARLSKEARNDEAVKHALAVRAAVSLGNYTSFFKLYRTAPNLSRYLMDKHVDKMRFEAVKCMTRSYRPSLPVIFIAQNLGFSGISLPDGENTKATEECDEWLRSHGAHIIFDETSNGFVLDTKASASSLFMPEPEDIVPHGDANLALNDFFSGRS